MNKATGRRYYLFFTLLSPLFGVYLSIRNLAWVHRKSILILAITLFGSTIVLSTSDGAVLKQMIYDHYVGLSFDRWLYELKEMILFSPEPQTKGDVFSHVASYVMGELLNMPGQYFILISFIYGLLYVGVMSKILVWTRDYRATTFFWAFVIIFISYRFVDSLQSVRTYTGAWILFTGVYGYHQTHRLKYILLILTAPLFHVGYFIIVIPALLALTSRLLSPIFFVAIYVASFFVELNNNAIITQIESTDLGQEKVAGYYHEDPADYEGFDKREANWYKRYGKNWALPNAPHLVAAGVLLMGLYRRRGMTQLELGMFATGLLMASLANAGDFIPVFYNRAMINAGLYILATLVLVLVRSPQQFIPSGWLPRVGKLVLWGSAGCFVPYLVYVLANMIQFSSFFMLIFPVFGFFEETNLSIRDLVSYLL